MGPDDNSIQFAFPPNPTESRIRWARQVLNSSHGGIRFSLSIPRIHLKILNRLFVREETVKQLQVEVRWSLLPHILENWALRGYPKGPKGKGQFLIPFAKVALYAAHELVVQTESDQILMDRVREILTQDPLWNPLLDYAKETEQSLGVIQRSMVIFLANRTLKPAFQLHNILPLTERDYTEVYRDFLNPTDRTRITSSFSPDPAIQSSWFNRLLGPEGQAARDFDLL